MLNLVLAVTTALNDTRPHIILTVADDLGWNDVSFHGSQQIPTPKLDALAHQGVIFDKLYVQPVCSPTRSSLLTGRHVIHSGIYDPDCGQGTTNAVPTEFTMLPVHLKQLGYETHAVGKWHLGLFAPDVTPTGRGFDSFFGYYAGAEKYFNHTVGKFVDLHNDSIAEGLSQAFGMDGKYSTHLYTQRAISLIHSFAERRLGRREADAVPPSLFLYLAYQAIHAPDEVPDSYQDRFIATIPDTPNRVGQHRRKVAGMVAALDEGIGNVSHTLEVVGMSKRTLIIFTTDNGGPAEGFNSNMASNWPLRGTKRTLWEGGVRAAGFAWGAGLRKSGYVSRALMHATDIPFSLLALAANGLERDPSGADWIDWRDHALLAQRMRATGEPPFELGDGMDMWPTISTGIQSPRTEVLLESHQRERKGEDARKPPREGGNGQALIVGDFKLVYEKGPMWAPYDRWYDSGSEPGRYKHTLDCGPRPSHKSPTYCHEPPCLFNLAVDPCEYVDLSSTMPHKFKELEERLKVYQAASVPASFHMLTGINCTDYSPSAHPEWQGFWMPFCAATASPDSVAKGQGTRLAGNEAGMRVLPESACGTSGSCDAALDEAYAACESANGCKAVIEPWAL